MTDAKPLSEDELVWWEANQRAVPGFVPDFLATIRAERAASKKLREALEKVDAFGKLEEAAGDDAIWTDDYRDVIETARAALTETER